MTVATTPNEIDFAGLGSVSPLTFPYSVHSSDELYIYTVVAGVETLRAVITDYNVAVASDYSSASITPTAPFAAAANGKTIRIRRTLPFQQSLDLVNAARLNSPGIELALDRAAMRDQQLHSRLTKAESTLGNNAAAAVSAAAAAVSAAAALVSQGAAATSASAGAASASAASTSQSAAAASASAASTSATAAAGSATSASGSAATATTQATAAAGSATSASGSATTATTQASAASASATAAAASATSASGSAATATTQASAASASATAAAASASSASGSAATATTQATAAAASATSASGSASTATTQATAAAASATSASGSASTATTQASAASASATAAAASATSAASSASSAASLYDQFDDRYLGSKSSDPTVDNDGNALIEGALYWSNIDKVLKVFDSVLWVAITGSGGGAVSSVFGRTGTILAAAGDFAASLITNDSGVSGAYVDDGLDTLNAGLGALTTTVTGQSASAVQTLTNKTMNATNNTLSNLTTAMFATNVVDTDPTLAANSNTRIPSQAAVKAYADNLATGLKWKASVLVRTTANITLSGEQTIDGVLTSASRVAVMNQSTASQNGIYVTAAGSWTRATDADTGNELVDATFFISQGTVYSDTIWTVTTNAITLGSTSVAFAQVSGAGTYSATGGVSLSSNQFSITSNGITDAMLRQSVGLSIVGRSANSTGNVADITATNDGEVLRRNGTSIGFGTVATAGLADDAVTLAKFVNASATSRILMRKTAGAGDWEEGTATDALNFIATARGTIPHRGASTWDGLAPGTAKQVLEANGAGADLAWAAPVGMKFLASGSVSAAATLDIPLTSYTQYRGLKLVVSSLVPATDDVNVYLRFSTDGGATFNAGASAYSYAAQGRRSSGTAETYSSAADSFIMVAGSGTGTVSVSNVASEGGAHLQIDIFDQANASNYTRCLFQSHWAAASFPMCNTAGSGVEMTAQDVDALRIIMESGNISSATWALYGYV